MSVHDDFIRAIGITGDANRAYRHTVLREEYKVGGVPILLPMDWTYRHTPAFRVSAGRLGSKYLF